MSEIDTYKLFRQIEARNKRKNPYKFYDNDELIDTILEKEDEIEKLQDQLQQKENIIKEVREYIEIIVKSSPSSMRKDYANMLLIDYKKVLEILDKGE